VASYGATAMGMQVMVSCAARIGGIDMPAKGQTTDVIEQIKKLDTKGRDFSVTSASVTYKEDDADGAPVYVTSLEGSIEDVPRGKSYQFTLKASHTKSSEDGTAYTGNYQFILKDFEDGKDLPVSIVYAWSDKVLKYRYRQAQISGASDGSFDAITGEIAHQGDNTDLSPMKWAEVVANVEPTGLGSLSISWASTSLNVFNATTKNDGTGVAYFGHRPMNTAPGSKEFHTIQGLRCFPVNPPPMGTEPYSSFVQRQTLKLDSASRKWVPETSNIKFAPTSSCSWNQANDSGQSASFTVSKEESAGGTTDEALSFPVDANLHSAADYKTSWTPPSAP